MNFRKVQSEEQQKTQDKSRDRAKPHLGGRFPKQSASSFHFSISRHLRFFPSSHRRTAGCRPRLWRMEFNAGMYEPLYWSFDAYPSVVPRVRVRGVMALFLAGTILWALVW